MTDAGARAPGAHDLRGKVAIVTGATRGIGLAIVEQLARAGARVVVSSRKADAVEEVAAGVRRAGGEALGVPAHVGRAEEARALVDRAVEAFGGVDVVVNNAATNPVYGPIVDTSDEAYEKIMAVNVKGPLEVCRRAYPSMRARGGGAVVNVSSIGGVSPEPGLGVYSMSKAALVSLTKVLAQEWGADGIRANVICPGLIRTRFSAALWQDERVMQHMMTQQPIKRAGEPGEVAALALFLASDAASYCTGGVYMVDGGYLL